MRAIRGFLVAIGSVSILIGILLLISLFAGGAVVGMSQTLSSNKLLALLFVGAFLGLGAMLIVLGSKRVRNLFRS